MAETKAGFIGRTGNFLAEVRQELRKVTWPTRSELYGATWVVISVTIVLSIALGLGDWALGSTLEALMAK